MTDPSIRPGTVAGGMMRHARPMTDGPIHHLALPDDWAAAFATGEYRMSTRGVTLDEDGFIHCSTRDQVEATANRFYGDVDQLVVLTIDPQAVPSPIRFEPPAPGSDRAVPPHLRPAADRRRHRRHVLDPIGADGWTLD